jgi:hypothetical protein
MRIDLPLVGFHSYRELSPVSAVGCALHHPAMTITVFNQRPV